VKTHLLLANGIAQPSLCEPRRFFWPTLGRQSRSRLAMETLEPRALLTANPTFASCAWMDTLPESYWNATCQAAASTASCPSTPAAATQSGNLECVDTVKSVSVRGGGSTTCIDSQPDCEAEVVKAVQQECATNRSCDTVPTCETVKADCQEQPTPQQQLRALYEKIAALLQKLDCEYDYDCGEPETPSAASESKTNGTATKRGDSSCEPDPPRYCNEPQRETRGQGNYSNKSENCRVVDYCWSDTNWSAAVNRACYR